MKSRNLNYVPQIDQLRFLAALLVFLFHYFHIYLGAWQPLPQYGWFGLISEGHTGVGLFFTLSGFIFMLIAQNGKRIIYSQFLINRLLRIAPLFLTVFMVAISIYRDRFVATDLLYLFVTNLGQPPTSWHILSGPAWSISIEFTFYLVFPFLAAFTLERGPSYIFKLLALMLVIKLGAFFAVENSRHVFYSTLVGRFDQFLIGMLAGMASYHYADFLKRYARLILAIGGAVLFAAIWYQARKASYFLPQPNQTFWIFWSMIEASLWSVIIVSFVASGLGEKSRIGKYIAQAGSWSFSIYMWHAFILYTAHVALGQVGGDGKLALALNGIVLLSITLLVSWISFTAIEQPFLSLRRKYIDEKPD